MVTRMDGRELRLAFPVLCLIIGAGTVAAVIAIVDTECAAHERARMLENLLGLRRSMSDNRMAFSGQPCTPNTMLRCCLGFVSWQFGRSLAHMSSGATQTRIRSLLLASVGRISCPSRQRRPISGPSNPLQWIAFPLGQDRAAFDPGWR